MEKERRRQACWRPFQCHVNDFDGSRRRKIAIGPPDGHAATASPKFKVDEMPEERVQDATAQKRWYVTEAFEKEQGQTMGCPRCSSGFGVNRRDLAVAKPYESKGR